MSRPAHGNGAVELTLKDLEDNRGYTIKKSGNQFILYCKKNVECGRISADANASGLSGAITGILARHNREH